MGGIRPLNPLKKKKQKNKKSGMKDVEQLVV